MTIGLRRPVFVFLLCCCPTWDKVLASSYFMFPSVNKSGTVLSSAVKIPRYCWGTASRRAQRGWAASPSSHGDLPYHRVEPGLPPAHRQLLDLTRRLQCLGEWLQWWVAGEIAVDFFRWGPSFTSWVKLFQIVWIKDGWKNKPLAGICLCPDTPAHLFLEPWVTTEEKPLWLYR